MTKRTKVRRVSSKKNVEYEVKNVVANIENVSLDFYVSLAEVFDQETSGFQVNILCGKMLSSTFLNILLNIVNIFINVVLVMKRTNVRRVVGRKNVE